MANPVRFTAKDDPVILIDNDDKPSQVYQQPTGWTPENPIEVTETEFIDLMSGDYLNTGYFYNVTRDKKASPIYEGLYVVDDESTAQPFDWNNMVTSDQLSQMAADEELTPNAIYYISDYHDDKETDAVVWAETNSKVAPIERSRTPKPIPEPEPDPKGWRSDDPIVCTGKELTGYIASSKLYQYYFYLATSTFEQIKAGTTYLAIDKNKVVEFDKNNAQLDEEIQKMAQYQTLTPNAYYFAINTEVIYLAVDTKTLEQIERTPVSDK